MAKKIDEAEELGNFLRSAATSIIHDDELHRKGTGIVRVAHELVMNGEVRLATDSLLITYLKSYPFIHMMENWEDPKGRVAFTFNMEEFKESEVLADYAQRHVKDMLAHAIKLDLQANNTRKRAEIVRDAISNIPITL